MSAGDEYFAEPEPGTAGPMTDAPPRLARGLRLARILLLISAGFAPLWLIGAITALNPSTQRLGAMLAVIAPEIVGGVLAWQLPRSPRLAGRPLITVAVVEIAIAVSSLGYGDVRGVVQLVLPIVVVVLLVRSRNAPTQEAVEAEQADAWWKRDDDGTSMIEYGALVVLVAVILSSLVSIGLQQTIGTDLRGEICRVFRSDGAHCSVVDDNGGSGGKSGTGNQAGHAGSRHIGNRHDQTPGAGGGSGWGNSRGGTQCHGFWGCTWNWTKQVGGFFVGIGKSLWQMVTGLGALGKGIFHAFIHPIRTAHAIHQLYEAAKQHPGQFFRQVGESLILGDAIEDWKKGHYGEAVGDVLTNLGTWFIPGSDIVTGLGHLGKLGDLAKLGEVGGKLGKVGDIAKLASKGDRAASRAAKAARSGDIRGAQKAARDADRTAKQAERRARRDGCKVGAVAFSPAGGGALPVHLGRMGAPMALPMEGGCDPKEKKIANEARNSAAAAKDAVGAAREQKVAELTGGKVAGEAGKPGLRITEPNVGSTDVDVFGGDGSYIAVGGPAKAKDLGALGSRLKILKWAAHQKGVGAQAYFEEGTPESVLKLARKHLGAENVHVFKR